MSRAERLRELIKKEASDILYKEIKDPRIGFVTVTDVEVSKDLGNVKIFVSILGTEKEKKHTMAGLKSAVGFVRSELGSRIQLRRTPEVVFKLDESIERSSRIMSLLRTVSDEKANGNKESEQ